MHCAGAVFKASQCVTAVLQGRTIPLRRATTCHRIRCSHSKHFPARRHVHSADRAVRHMLPRSHNGSVQTVTSEFLSEAELSPGTHLHLVVLNYVLPSQTANLWHRATTRICADGGANRLYDQLPVMLPGTDPVSAREAHLPDLIKGDLDSVRPDVTDFYASRGVPFVDLSSDQDTTDLEKCLLFLEGRLRALSEAAAKQPAMVAVATAAAGHSHARVAAQGPGSIAVGSNGRSLDTGSCAASALRQSSVNLAPLTPSGADAQQQQQQLPQQLIYGEIVMMPDLQQQQQQRTEAGDSSSLVQLPHSHNKQTPSGNGSDPRHGSNGSSSQQHAHELHATILASHDAAGDAERVRKRMQQDHQILVLGALGGRLDHTLANLNTLYCYRHLNITLWGDGNLVRLLRAGKSVIHPSRLEGPTCGLVPLAAPAVASSKGLKWDLDNTHMCFRGLLSTSNVISSDTIEVTSNEDLLWITAVGETMLPAE